MIPLTCFGVGMRERLPRHLDSNSVARAEKLKALRLYAKVRLAASTLVTATDISSRWQSNWKAKRLAFMPVLQHKEVSPLCAGSPVVIDSDIFSSQRASFSDRMAPGLSNFLRPVHGLLICNVLQIRGLLHRISSSVSIHTNFEDQEVRHFPLTRRQTPH